MILLIALPIVSVFVQSLYVEHEQILKVTKNCTPFGCKEETTVDFDATQALRKEAPLGKFNGFDTYANRSHLAFFEVKTAWQTADGLPSFFSNLMNLPFYKALAFTLSYTFIVTPFVIVLGLAIALGVNALPKVIKGPTIFVSLLPMIVTPLIGSLILFWMIDAKGIIGATLQIIFDDPDLSLKASPALTWITLFVYGIWHSAPFSFIVFYAGLQTVPEETLEAAMIDGAGFFRMFFRILLPSSGPIIVVTIIWQFTNIWNDFLFGASFASGDTAPITVALNNLVNSSTGVKEYNVHMAGAMIAALPTLLVYILAGRYFVRGLMAGSVKG